MSKKFNLSSLKTNLEKQSKGIWIEYGGGLDVLIGKVNSPKYKEYIRKAGAKYRHQIDRGTVDPDVIEDLVKKAMSKFVLLDWRNMYEEEVESSGNPVLDKDGEPKLVKVEYSEEKAYEILSNKEFDEFYETISSLASDHKLFLEETIKLDSGN